MFHAIDLLSLQHPWPMLIFLRTRIMFHAECYPQQHLISAPQTITNQLHSTAYNQKSTRILCSSISMSVCKQQCFFLRVSTWSCCLKAMMILLQLASPWLTSTIMYCHQRQRSFIELVWDQTAQSVTRSNTKLSHQRLWSNFRATVIHSDPAPDPAAERQWSSCQATVI